MHTSQEVYRAQEYDGKYFEAYKMRQAVRSADTVTVEFGTANTPLYLESPVEFDDRNVYVGVNIDPAQHEFLRHNVEQVGGYASLAKIDTEGNVNTLLPDESVDTVFMANVFGEPDDRNIGLRYMFPTDDERYAGHSSIEAKTRTLEESRRLLKPDGAIVILETNTPYIGRSEHTFGEEPKPKYSGMVRLLEESGYEVRAAIAIRDEGWADVVGQFATPSEWWDNRNSYMVIAEKRHEQ